MAPSIQRGRLTVAGLMAVVLVCTTGFCVGLPVAIGDTRGALRTGSGLPLLLVLVWMLWRGSLMAKWIAVVLLVVEGLWTGSGALFILLGVIPPASDLLSQAIVQDFVYGLAAWALFSLAVAVVLTLSPSVQEFLRVQRAYYCKKPSEHA